jgi:predicted outer membrane repeat protein
MTSAFPGTTRVLAWTAAASTAAALGLVGLQTAAAAPVTSVGCSAADLASAIATASSGASLSLAFDCTYKLTTGLTATVGLSILGNGDTVEPATGSASMTMLTFAAATTDSISSLSLINANGGAMTGPLAHDGGAIASHGTLTLTNTSFDNDAVSGGAVGENEGGAIVNDGTLDVDGSTFIGDSAPNAGGAIITSGPLTVTGSTFRKNTATVSGAAIYSDDSPVTTVNCDFVDNSGGSGGIAMDGGGPLTVTGGQFTGDKATGPDELGGAIETFVDTEATIRHVSFSDDSATENGGAIYAYEDSPLNVTDSAFSRDTAGADGGAIYADDKSPVDVTGGSFTEDRAGTDGGAIYAADSNVTEVGGLAEHDTAAHDGGAIALFPGADGGTGSITGVTFKHDTVTATGGWGGAIYTGALPVSSPLTVSQSDFTANTAPLGQGGAIWTDSRATDVTKSGFYQNEAKNGGAVFNHDGAAVLTITDTKAESNRASDDGGALYNDTAATAHLDHSEIAFNLAGTAGGGGIYNLGTATLTSTAVFSNHPDNCAPAASVPGC